MKKSAFTMAEIMITMTIIGVIAILTLPTRMVATKTKAYNVLFKSTFAQFQDGLTNAANVHKHSFVYVGGDDTATNSKYTLDEYLADNFNAKPISTVWQPAIGEAVEYTYSGVSGVTSDKFSTMSKAYKLQNGVTILFPEASIKVMNATGCTKTNPCPAYIDINGSDDPNSIVSCEGDTDTSQDLTEECKIDTNSGYDMFPITIQKDHIYPATNATDFILNK